MSKPNHRKKSSAGSNKRTGAKSAASTPARSAARSSAMEAKPVPNQVTTQAIAEAAYFLWQQRGGNELINWLEAEASLRTPATQQS